MKHLYTSFRIKLALLFVICTCLSISAPLARAGDTVLARVELTGTVDQLGLPVHAHLQGGDGVDYALVIAPEKTIRDTGSRYTILDTAPVVRDGQGYIIALERIDGARKKAAAGFHVLMDDGRNIVVKLHARQTTALAKLGFELEWLDAVPMVFKKPTAKTAPVRAAASIVYDATIAGMIHDVTQATLEQYIGNITGETPVNIGGSSYTITTRHTSSGTPIEKATQYMYEFMQGLGLSVSYHNWTYWFTSNRNVIGEKTGSVKPNEIVLITAHLDSLPSSGPAPGADDNGSGSVAVMTLAEIFSTQDFERTLRFVFFTGEEQGLYGSKKYADAVSSAGDNIVAVYNMDMLAWDDIGGPTLRLHTRTTSSSGYNDDMVLANTFVDVVNTYGLSTGLTPIIDSDGITASDHSPFWNKGIPAILAIEDDEDDFCDNYHTANDKMSTLNFTYFTNYVKASLGTCAYLAAPLTLRPDFTFNASGLTVSFTDTSDTIPGSTITERVWQFGDSTLSTQLNPTHTYAAPGSYTVSLSLSDDQGNSRSIFKPITVTNTLNYCDANSTNYSYEWIKEVIIGTYIQVSQASGYSDFTDTVFQFTKGVGKSVSLSPGFSSSTYTENWRIWIDLNQDGDFEDAGEMVMEGSGTSTVTGTITIPATASEGYTRMRVAMQYGSAPSPCGAFEYGEVEDYTVKISN